eukprot:363437-Chlamydomonas_euryale.AAC.7
MDSASEASRAQPAPSNSSSDSWTNQDGDANDASGSARGSARALGSPRQWCGPLQHLQSLELHQAVFDSDYTLMMIASLHGLTSLRVAYRT